MHPRTTLAAITAAFSLQAAAQQVTIVESLSGNFWAVQDSIWNVVATNMGFTSSIVPQSALDDLSNLDGTDILIVSSGTISYTGTDHLQTIVQYVQSGRPAYIQSEYTTSFQGTITFDSLMNAVGADFNWTGTVSGSLVPMNILGDLATTPNAVPTLSYYNYGCAGIGAGVQEFMQFNGQFFGFYYTDPSGTNGCVLTNSDEDWVWNNTSQALMGNFLSKLSNCQAQGQPEFDVAHLSVTVPTLFSNSLELVASANEQLTVRLFDASGRALMNGSFTGSISLNTTALPTGVYLYEVRNAAGLVKTGKAVRE